MLSFWPFCSGVLPSPTPSLSLRARLQLPKGSCHPPPLPTASCCPQKQQWSLSCLAGDFRELGMDSFPWEPSPTISQRDRCCVRPCHPLPLPVPALGTSTAAAGSGGACQGGSVPVGQLPPPPQAVSKWLHFGRERWPHGVEARWWECAKPPAALMSAVGRFSAAPGPAWLLHTHEVPVWHVEEQRLGPACGRLWQPCWEASPTHPSDTILLSSSSAAEPGKQSNVSQSGAGLSELPTKLLPAFSPSISVPSPSATLFVHKEGTSQSPGSHSMWSTEAESLTSHPDTAEDTHAGPISSSTTWPGVRHVSSGRAGSPEPKVTLSSRVFTYFSAAGELSSEFF